MTARAGRTVAAVIAAIALAGCHFAVVPPKATHSPQGAATPDATSSQAEASSVQRLADAPALLVQCMIDRANLHPPAGQDWVHNGKVSITSTTVTAFSTWWRTHDTPGPYAATFVIDGHRTHYLAFGATWVTKNGQWVPTHTARTDPIAQRQSLYDWATWAALHDKLPPAVCGTSVTASQLQAQVFGSASAAGNPWAA